MSVALIIQPRSALPEEARLVPIATQDVFKRYWLPVSHVLKLAWVPRFETGFPLRIDDIEDVLAELRQLKTWIEVHSSETVAVIEPRIDRLISELESIKGRHDLEVYIG